MTTWNEIITMTATPDKRLNELFGLWQDILEIYKNPEMIYFDPNTFCAVVEPNYNRILYPSNTTSVLKNTASSQKPNTDPSIKLLIDDDRYFRLIKALSGIYNQSLTKTQREIMARYIFFRESRQTICSKCSISARTYYRYRKVAKIILIMNYCLDHYDEYGIEKHNWLDVSKDRQKWNNGHYFKDDIHDWPEFINS